MKIEEARLYARSLKNMCIDRNGNCWNEKEGCCNNNSECVEFFKGKIKPKNHDLIDIIYYIKENF